MSTSNLSLDNLDMSNTFPTFNKETIHNLQAVAEKAAQVFKAMSHPDRLILLFQLTQGEFCVGTLEELVGIGQPSLSQQLGILRKEAIVNTRRDGKQIFYSLASDDVLAILHLILQRFG